VLRSAYPNKVNEVNTHRAWAERTLLRAEVFGVANDRAIAVVAAGAHRNMLPMSPSARTMRF
jgi:hypothetical protein